MIICNQISLLSLESVAVVLVSLAVLCVAVAKLVLENWMARKQDKEESLMP